ncbi:hypothetical protein GLYMA_18G227000v4 [Glycine max]|uniref:Uncharacterized protein n=1 Tax=Glycine max TaxID=3847 RepID=A0A0R0FEE3_SOYBN|nr:hypothetical protein JHK86_051193 [Glycine max]KAG4925516.1 hypothetical protein JHK87_051056 [Glycine soja]KAG4937130.1 hypothetical protein JHK85_052049 [Glycine max]KRH00655.1 hypothetical protein GLYMA_18G227000v4 [Glycine max]
MTVVGERWEFFFPYDVDASWDGIFHLRLCWEKDYSDGSCCYSSLSSHPSGIVVVINSYGQPGKWFMLLAPLLVLDVYMDFYVFILGRHIYFIF